MPSIEVDFSGLPAGRALSLAETVRRSVVAALPDVAAVCSCRARPCVAARPGGSTQPAAWIGVALFPGRTLEWKRTLYRALVDACAEAGIGGDAVSITVREPALENWGIRGGIPGVDVFEPSSGRAGP